MNHASPLRYPGGKQKLTPFIGEILGVNDLIGGAYAEPYAGGAGVGLRLLLDEYVSKIYLNDANPAVFAFWRSVIDETESLCRLIRNATLTIPEWRRQKELLLGGGARTRLELGFSALYLNRCNRSGIFSGGVIGGLAQTGNWLMDARFTRNELITRIEAIATKRSKIRVSNLDAISFMRKLMNWCPQNTLVYCDPPYFQKAERLYLNSYKAKDHCDVSEFIQWELSLPWLVSYDCAPEICELYSDRRSFTYNLQYNASKVYQGQETFFFSDGLELPENSALPSIDAALRDF